MWQWINSSRLIHMISSTVWTWLETILCENVCFVNLINFTQLLYVCLVAQSCSTDHNPLHCTPPGSSVHGISQARIVEWVAISFSRGSSWSRDQTQVSCVSWMAGRFFTRWTIPPIFLTLWIGQKALKHILLHNNNSEVCSWLLNLEYISKCYYGALD